MLRSQVYSDSDSDLFAQLIDATIQQQKKKARCAGEIKKIPKGLSNKSHLNNHHSKHIIHANIEVNDTNQAKT